MLPRYGGQSLLNVAATVCQALGAPIDGLASPLDREVLPSAFLEGVRAVVVLVVDGLGRAQLDAGVAEGSAPTLAALVERAGRGDAAVSLSTITSIFPSSTMPAIATLNTGLPPAAHALLGWTVYLEEFGEAAELARWGPAARWGSYADDELGKHDPSRFLGVETVHRRLGRAGVRSVAICPAQYRGTGFTSMVFDGAKFPGYYATSSLFVLAERLLDGCTPDERVYVYGYWPTLDTVSHHRGIEREEHAEELATLDFALGRWLARHGRREDLLFLLTADHGHVASDPRRMVRLDRPALLTELLAPPTGERRLAYLHARPDRADAVRAWCVEHLAGRAELLDSDDAFARGLFGPGPVAQAARRRAGDLILLARQDYQFVCPFSDRQKIYPLIGNHGALAAAEMLVPLLAVRL